MHINWSYTYTIFQNSSGDEISGTTKYVQLLFKGDVRDQHSDTYFSSARNEKQRYLTDALLSQLAELRFIVSGRSKLCSK